jgi:hypothetical protein
VSTPPGKYLPRQVPSVVTSYRAFIVQVARGRADGSSCWRHHDGRQPVELDARRDPARADRRVGLPFLTTGGTRRIVLAGGEAILASGAAIPVYGAPIG